jgi:hypothetical protein
VGPPPPLRRRRSRHYSYPGPPAALPPLVCSQHGLRSNLYKFISMHSNQGLNQSKCCIYMGSCAVLSAFKSQSLQARSVPQAPHTRQAALAGYHDIKLSSS